MTQHTSRQATICGTCNTSPQKGVDGVIRCKCADKVFASNVGVFMLTDLVACVIIPLAQFTAAHAPALDISAQEIRLEELEHSHHEHDTSMFEHTLFDVHSPMITGGMVESQQSFVLLEAANRGVHNWWVTTPLGKPFIFGNVLRACATAKHRKAAVQCPT